MVVALLCRVGWCGSLLVIPLGLLVGAPASVQLNIWPLLPYGRYRLHAVPSPLTRGMVVVVQVPGWRARTQPFLKPGAAVAGEWVCRVGPALVPITSADGPVYEAWRGHPI